MLPPGQPFGQGHQQAGEAAGRRGRVVDQQQAPAQARHPHHLSDHGQSVGLGVFVQGQGDAGRVEGRAGKGQPPGVHAGEGGVISGRLSGHGQHGRRGVDAEGAQPRPA